MGKSDKKEHFLVNLGRANMRGLRRCLKCGTLNGTRGFICKNKLCDVIFKDIESIRKKGASGPCKINTGTDSQIYSVRVRDKGPDYRGFVQIFPENEQENSSSMLGAICSDDQMTEKAKCYVDSCHMIDKYLVGSCRSQGSCIHVKLATECTKTSQPLTLKTSVMNTLAIPQPFKEEIYSLATSTPGPLVQRVSSNMAVIKCKPDSVHPLGFLHFNLIPVKNKKDFAYKLSCSCRFMKYRKDSSFKKCVHLFACIVALASDNALSKEFSHYIDLLNFEPKTQNLCLNLVLNESNSNLENPLQATHDSDRSELIPSLVEDVTVSTSSASCENSLGGVDESAFLILNEDEGKFSPCEVQVEVDMDDTQLLDITESDETDVITEHTIEEDLACEKEETSEICIKSACSVELLGTSDDDNSIDVHHFPQSPSPLDQSLEKETTPISSASAISNHISSGFFSLQKISPKKRNCKSGDVSLKKILKLNDLSESSISMSFIKWLSSTIERMNQCMHYGFSGKPEPLVYHIPKSFFELLMERIRSVTGAKANKLSIENQTFYRRDSLPIGKFMKYTIRLYSLIDIKNIFITSEVSLEPIRYFSPQRNGPFKLKTSGSLSMDDLILDELSHESSRRRIKLLSNSSKTKEYKTVLCAGAVRSTSDSCIISFPSSSSQFIIEWTPDILPISEIGELKIKFEFDQYIDGKLSVVKDTLSTAIIVPQLVSNISSTGKSLGPPLAPKPVIRKVIHESVIPDKVFTLPDSVGPSETITVLTF